MAKKFNKSSVQMMSFGRSIDRISGQVLDPTEVWNTDLDARHYAATDQAYVGQVLKVVNTSADGSISNVNLYVITDESGTLTPIETIKEVYGGSEDEATYINTISSEECTLRVSGYFRLPDDSVININAVVRSDSYSVNKNKHVYSYYWYSDGCIYDYKCTVSISTVTSWSLNTYNLSSDYVLEVVHDNGDYKLQSGSYSELDSAVSEGRKAYCKIFVDTLGEFYLLPMVHHDGSLYKFSAVIDSKLIIFTFDQSDDELPNLNNNFQETPISNSPDLTGVLKDSDVGVKVATLEDGKIPSSQLPSYVDDVIDVHIINNDIYRVTGGVQTGRSVLSNNIFSIVNSKNIISNFDPSIGEDLEELHIAHGSSINLRYAATGDNRVPIQDATGYYTISAEFQDDKSYIEVYDQLGSIVRATISSSQPSATFYSSAAAAGSVQLQFKNNLGNTLIIKKLQVSIGEEVLDYQKYGKRYEYLNPVTGEYVTADLVTPECGKIYIDILNGANKTYRWSGSALVEISKSLVLGTTSTTAYRGDYGNTAYQHSLKTSGNPHKVTKSNVGLGNVTNDAQVKRSEMGVAGGVATLDSSGKIPSSQLPSSYTTGDVVEGRYDDSIKSFLVESEGGEYPGINILDLSKAVVSCDGEYDVDLSNGYISVDSDIRSMTVDLSSAINMYAVSSSDTLVLSVKDHNSVTISLLNYNDEVVKSMNSDNYLLFNVEEGVKLLLQTDNYIGLYGLQITTYDNIDIGLNEYYIYKSYRIIDPESSKIYIDINTNKFYRWSGDKYIDVSALTDTTLSKEGYPADAFSVGQRLGDIETVLNELHNYAQALINGGTS